MKAINEFIIFDRVNKDNRVKSSGLATVKVKD